jgi:hypothetical protein
VLRQAFDATMRDPDPVAKVRARNIRFNPMSGGDLAAVVARTIAARKSVIDRYGDRPLQGVDQHGLNSANRFGCDPGRGDRSAVEKGLATAI